MRSCSKHENDFTHFLLQTTSVSIRPYVSYPEDESDTFPGNVLKHVAPHGVITGKTEASICVFRKSLRSVLNTRTKCGFLLSYQFLWFFNLHFFPVFFKFLAIFPLRLHLGLI